MASTVTLQDVIRWASTHIKLQPITGVGGYQQEPALSICNDVIQEILSSPYNWKFNRVELPSISTDLTAYTQDYQTTATDIQWLESGTRVQTNTTQNPPPTNPVFVVNELPPTDQVGVPTRACFINETDAGGVIRFDPIPDITTPYNINIVYQAKPPVKYGVQETWTPIPDELGYVYRQGFLALAYRAVDDPRADREYLKFQAMIQKALGIKDMEDPGTVIYPAGGLALG